MGWSLLEKGICICMHMICMHMICMHMICMHMIYMHMIRLGSMSLLTCTLFFPGPLAFCKKAVERVSSEKNILNSSVDLSGVFFFRKSHMYAHHQIRLNELIDMMHFIFNLNPYFSRN